VTETLETKPTESLKELTLIDGGMTGELPKELENSLGEAVEKMLDPNLAIMSGELSQRERICLTALYMKYKITGLRIYKRYLRDFMVRTVPYRRKRAGELVEVLKGVTQLKHYTVGQRIREKLGI